MSLEKKGPELESVQAVEKPRENRLEVKRESDQENEGNPENTAEEIDKARMAVEAAAPETTALAVKTLSPEEKKDFYAQLEVIKNGEFKNKRPALATGGRIDAEYDCQVNNFSTQTKVVTLASGRKLFAVFNYPTSWVHRKLDTLMKTMTGAKMGKAKSQDWKETFESRSQIPTITNEDPNLVVMDYLPNVNLYDLFVNQFAKNKDGSPMIKNFGECQFADGMNMEELLGVLEKVVEKVKQMHEKGVQWGEVILPNIIIDKDEEVHICDPETEYDEKVPVAERQARDIYVLIMSSAAAMKKSKNVDYSAVVKNVLDKYQLDEETKAELKNLAEKKMGLGQKVFFGYTKANYGLKDKAEYAEIRQAMSQYLG